MYVYRKTTKQNQLRRLGVTLHSNARFNQLIVTDGNVTKANQTLSFLRWNLKIYFMETKELTYKSLVRPVLECASTAWDRCPERCCLE